jgi:hypothetical protein
MGSGASHSKVYAESGEAGVTELEQETKSGENNMEMETIEWPNIGDCDKFSTSDRDLCSWKFDIWKLDPEDIPILCSSIILYHSLPGKFKISYEKWCGLYRQVETNMSTSINPYHNFIHIVDVMQTCAAFLGEMGASCILTDTDVLSLFLSAFLHDIGHPGLNNVYQVNAETSLALRYNDISVLENHHCALAFQIFRDPQSNIFLEIPTALRKQIRKSMIEMILSTDMISHFTLTEELDNCVTRHFTPLATANEMSAVVLPDKDRVIMLRSILHAADISNPAKPWETAKKWSDLVVQEFFAQGDLEKAQGLPVATNNDRCLAFQDEISLNFNDFIVAPFFLTLLKALPKLEKSILCLETNRFGWDKNLRNRVSARSPAASEKLRKE